MYVEARKYLAQIFSWDRSKDEGVVTGNSRCRRQFRFSFPMVYRGVKWSLMSSIASFNAWNIGIVSQLRARVTHPPSLVFCYAQQLQQINRSNEEFRENFGGLNIFLNSEPRGNCYERFLLPLKEFTNRLISRTNLSKNILVKLRALEHACKYPSMTLKLLLTILTFA